MKNFILAFMAVSLAASLTLAESRGFVFKSAYTALDSKNYTGSLLAVGVESDSIEGFKLFPNYQRLERKFSGGVAIEESALDLQGVMLLPQNRYLEMDFFNSPSALILPRTALAAILHEGRGAFDLSGGLALRRYATVDSATANGDVTYSWDDVWFAGASVFVTFTDETLNAGHGHAEYRMTEEHRVRADIAGGKTLEDAGLSATFNAVSAEYTYRRPRWSVSGSVGQYWSTLRTENSVGLRFEVGL